MAQRGLARTGRLACAAALALAGCGDQAAEYPALMPTDQLLASPTLPAHALDAADSVDATAGGLTAQRDALHGRADRAIAQGGRTGDLAARADALRERARVLAATPVNGDPAENCDAGDADCTAPPETESPQDHAQ